MSNLLELVIRKSPTAIALLRGPDFVIEMVNPACQALSPGEEIFGKTVAAVWPDAAGQLIPLLQAVREGGVPHFSTGQLVPMHGGSDSPGEERYFDFSCVPLAPAGDVRVLMAVSEVTAHKRVEARLQAACAELTAIYANAPVALFVIDDEFRVEKVNDLAARFAGRLTSDIVGQWPGEAFGCLSALGDPARCGKGPVCAYCAIRTAAMDSLTNGARHVGVEAWLPGATEEACLLISTSPMQFSQARKVLVCAQDITEQKRTQRALESALAEKTILLKEIHHRVKNNLAVVCSLLSMKADAVTNPTAKQALLESQQRVYSMALIHEHLYGNERLDRINFADYATQLVRRLHAAVATEPDRIAIELALEPIELAIEQAVPCALILNELLTNAFKYAFRGRSRGRIAISFRTSSAGFHELAVEDDGVGIQPNRTGETNGNSLGLRIVHVLTRQLDGTLEQEPCSGTRVVLRFPAGKPPLVGDALVGDARVGDTRVGDTRVGDTRVGDNRPQCAR
jgi:two-component sensor histidine kinase/PAS domain-containing protein